MTDPTPTATSLGDRLREEARSWEQNGFTNNAIHLETLANDADKMRSELDETRDAYRAWHESGQEMHAVLLEIWHLVTPGDTKHMTYGEPRTVSENARAEIQRLHGMADRVRTILARWNEDPLYDTDDMVTEALAVLDGEPA